MKDAAPVLGFTGSRNEPTMIQIIWLAETFKLWKPSKLHHGACVGADAEAHKMAVANKVQVIVHPPENQKLMMLPDALLSLHGGVSIRSPKPYLDRNRDIVDASDMLIALPGGPQRPKSGTWYTINYALRQKIPVHICYPDGSADYHLQRERNDDE